MMRINISGRNKKLFLFIVSTVGCFASYCQTVFIGRDEIASKRVFSIANLAYTPTAPCECECPDTCAHTYKFLNGRLTEEYWYNTTGEKQHNSDMKLIYTYANAKTKRLVRRTGNLEHGRAVQQYFAQYLYSANKLSRVVYGSVIPGRGVSSEQILSISKFSYLPEGKLNRVDDYVVEKNAAKMRKDTTLVSTRFYLYRSDTLVGFFPAKDYKTSELDIRTVDSLYSEEKISELARIGWNAFSKKYLQSDEAFNKIRSDCYTPVKQGELLINRIPATRFFKTVPVCKGDYLVIEIADNYFLFFHLKG